jgi:hypothetical protein
MWRDRMEESRPLWVFMQVACLGTVSAAANAMLLSSAAIRKAIGKLEAQLKTPLVFQRRTTAATHGRGAVPVGTGRSKAGPLETFRPRGVRAHIFPCMLAHYVQ